jgi:pilus assembly protein Flp/PilA
VGAVSPHDTVAVSARRGPSSEPARASRCTPRRRPSELGRGARPRLAADAGVTAIEYALLAGLIAVAIILGVGLLGGKVGQYYDNLSQAYP